MKKQFSDFKIQRILKISSSKNQDQFQNIEKQNTDTRRRTQSNKDLFYYHNLVNTENETNNRPFQIKQSLPFSNRQYQKISIHQVQPQKLIQKVQSKEKFQLMNTRNNNISSRGQEIRKQYSQQYFPSSLNNNLNLQNIRKIQPIKITSNMNKNQLISEKNLIYNIEPSRCSEVSTGIVKAYGANTHKGLYRSYNEDRVAIVLNVVKPNKILEADWPQCSFFAIYDGHAGVSTADYLRDNLHMLIVNDENFPSQPQVAIKRGILRAEQVILQRNQLNNDQSGSCAIVLMIIDDMIYIANIGDSRAILSLNGGQDVKQLTQDHKPESEFEQKRIILAGGRVYQNSNSKQSGLKDLGINFKNPFRVYPGKLSVIKIFILFFRTIELQIQRLQVSRAIGDFEAKLPSLGGNPKVVIADPDITSFKITEDMDFILLGCDGIFDRLTSEEVSKAIWSTLQNKFNNQHQFAGIAIENLFAQALDQNTLDNITSVIICFKNMDENFSKNKIEQQDKQLLQNLKQLQRIPSKSSYTLSTKQFRQEQLD